MVLEVLKLMGRVTMGRRKGLKNKPKVDKANIDPSTEVVALNDVTHNITPSVEVKEVKSKYHKGYVPDNPTWVLTETARGTPIAIVDICNTEGTCYLMVIPHYKERESKTTINSASVIRPNFTNREIEKEFDGVPWYVGDVKKPVDESEVKEDALNADAIEQK